MNRTDFQQLAELRLKEAEVLLNQGCFDGAYYLLGYVVECAFKACIAKQTKEHDFPPKAKVVGTFYQHKAKDLLKAITLQGKQAEERLAEERLASAVFDDNWKIVEVWSEESRYEKGRSEKEVQDFFSAITGDEGVFHG
ncbi:MAG: DNA-binding protein [Pyrinomonadaceae bacterium]